MKLQSQIVKNRRCVFNAIATIAMTVPLAMPTAASARPPTTAPTCPSLLVFGSLDERSYDAVIASKAPVIARLGLTLYTRAGFVVTSQRIVRIDKEPFQRGGLYRSLPLVIASSSNGPYLGSRLQITSEAGTPVSCPPSDRIAMAVPQWPLGSVDAVVAEANSQPVITPTAAAYSAPPACSKPFVDASILGPASQPDYHGAGSHADATRSGTVKVSIDAAGNVTRAKIYKSTGNVDLDNASLEAARTTRYQPLIFLCGREDGGDYFFMTDFAGT